MVTSRSVVPVNCASLNSGPFALKQIGAVATTFTTNGEYSSTLLVLTVTKTDCADATDTAVSETIVARYLENRTYFENMIYPLKVPDETPEKCSDQPPLAGKACFSSATTLSLTSASALPDANS